MGSVTKFNLAGYKACLIGVIVAALYLASALPLGSERPSRKKTAAKHTTRVVTRRRRNEERSDSQISQHTNQSHITSAASWNDVNVHRRRREEQEELPQQPSLYFLTLFIQFDDYASTVGWLLQDESNEVVDSRMAGGKPYRYFRRGENATETIRLDDYFDRDSEQSTTKWFRFAIISRGRGGLRRGGYYQLNFTNAFAGDTTELGRASRFGSKSVVKFTLGFASSPQDDDNDDDKDDDNDDGDEEANGAETAVQVLDSSLSPIREPTASPTSPPTPALGTSFLRLKLDYPSRELHWQLALLNPQTLRKVSVVRSGFYTGPKDLVFHAILPVEANKVYEFSMVKTRRIAHSRSPDVFELTFVPATHRQESDEVPLSLTKIDKRSSRSEAVSFAVDLYGSMVHPATAGPTVAPTFQPTEVHPASEFSGNPYEGVLFLIVAFATMYTLFRMYRGRRVSGTNSGTNSDNVQAESQQNQPRQQPRNEQSSRLVGGLSPDERLRYIRKHLLSVPIGSMADEKEALQCAICLVEYEDGDVVCFSSNSQCEHKFHRDCMMAWLQNHEECPCCRLAYLPNENRDEV